MKRKLTKSESGRLGGLASVAGTKKRCRDMREKYYQNPKICENNSCQTPISFETKNTNKFCSRTCARRSGRTGRQAKLAVCAHTKCNNIVKTYESKYCSRKCYDDYKKIKNNLKIEAGLGNATSVKRYLLEKHGNKCMDSKCIWDFNVRSINVELEHIDGNSTNNTLENCILLCPNCHSLTPTYKNRNKGKGRWRRRKRYAEGKSY